jgi:hypothetical protein
LNGSFAGNDRKNEITGLDVPSMDDPTGGMWIYLIFIIIPLARILPRLLRKYRNKGTVHEQDEQNSMKGFFTDKLIPERPRFREEEPPERPRFREPEPQPEPQPKPDKKDGWVGKDDFK